MSTNIVSQVAKLLKKKKKKDNLSMLKSRL